jgi:hypothetical protein
LCLVGGPVGRSIGNKETILGEIEERRLMQVSKVREKVVNLMLIKGERKPDGRR